MDIKGKTIAVTGAARGIGQIISRDLAARGARVAPIDLTADSMDRTLELCAAAGSAAQAYVADVSDEASVEAAMDRIVADSGRLDGLVNNAGIIRDGLLIKTRDGKVEGRMSVEQWRAVIDVNLTGTFLCGRAAAERMVGLGRGGVIINISSVCRAGNAGQSNYSAAKAGVAALATVWSKELARYRIRAASIAPGYIRTEMLESIKPEVLEKVIAPVPAKRLGEVSEISSAVCFILENDFVNGRCLEIDGGLRI